MGTAIAVPLVGKAATMTEPLQNFEGTLYFWRAVETSEGHWQPQWGTCRKHETTTEWRDYGRPVADQFKAEDFAQKYAEYIAAKM